MYAYIHTHTRTHTHRHSCILIKYGLVGTADVRRYIFALHLGQADSTYISEEKVAGGKDELQRISLLSLSYYVFAQCVVLLSTVQHFMQPFAKTITIE